MLPQSGRFPSSEPTGVGKSQDRLVEWVEGTKTLNGELSSMYVPVVGKYSNPFIQTKPSWAKGGIKEGKSLKAHSDIGIFSVGETSSSSDPQTHNVVIGIDRRKHYSGIGVQSSRFSSFVAHPILLFEMDQKMVKRPCFSCRPLHLLQPSKRETRRVDSDSASRRSGDTARRVSVSELKVQQIRRYVGFIVAEAA